MLLASAVQFFVYDSIKILLLLFGFIFVIGFFRTFLCREKIRQWMNQKGLYGHLYAALFGAVTPFCSCSSIPIFLGFLNAGVPLGVAFSFLITSPLINEYLVVLMLGFFGWKITVTYVILGLAIGIFTGMILGRMKLERYLEPDFSGESADTGSNENARSFSSRIRYGLSEAVSIVRKIWLWVLIGVAAGALIHNYIPEKVIQEVISKTGNFSVPIAVLLGVPMYGNCAAIVPIALVLFQKGFPLGTALALMMAISALSLPEAILLRCAFKLKLIAIFFSLTAAAIMLTGYLFNFLQGVLL